MADYLPAGIADFVLWMANFGNQIGVHGATVGATPAEIADFQADTLRFATEVLAVDSDRNAYRAAEAVRDDDRSDTIEPRLRPFVQRIQHYPAMTNAIRRDLGITVPDDTPTPLSEVAIEEVGAPLLVVDIGQSKRATLKFGRNPLNQRQNALPAGMRGVRLWYFIGSGPPPNEKDWQFLDDDNRSPYTHVTMNPDPMTVTYRAAYVDPHNRVGEHSEPVIVTINP